MNLFYSKRVIFTLFVLFLSNVTFAQNSKLQGIVLDFETNQPLIAAAIELLNEKQYTISDKNGIFNFDKLNTSPLKIRITYLGYKEGIFTIDCNQEKCSKLIFFLIPEAVEVSTIIITDHNEKAVFDDLANLSNVLSGRKLEKDLSVTLASTLKNETGLAMRSMGPAPSRPVIRGLGGDRVVLSEDGNKTVDLSATSPDHAVTIEPFGIERIEVIRGPKLLLQTSSTIGGIVNVIKNEIPTKIHEAPFGTLGFYAETVNRGFLGSAKFEVPISDFELRGEISKRKTLDLSTPIGILKNTYSDNSNFSFGSSYIHNFGLIGASFRGFTLNYGVPGGFLGAHPNGVDIEMQKYQSNGKVRFNLHSDKIDHIIIDFSQVYYRHKEFEKNGSIGAEFLINQYLMTSNLDFKNLFFDDEGTLGISSNYRDFKIGGFVFTPPSNSTNVSAYFYDKMKFNNFQIEWSSRINYDLIKPKYDDYSSGIGEIRKREFTTFSGSISAIYSLTRNVAFGGNISKSSRVPTIEELFSEGPHLAAYSYEIGNPDLNAETGLGSEVFLYHNYDKLKVNVNIFYNYLPYYIIPRNTGEINWATFLPIFASTGVDALLTGSEMQVDWNIFQNLSLNLSASYTYGEIVNEKVPLPQIPPLKGIVGINYISTDINFGVSGEWANSQKRVDYNEEPTAGYFILNIYGQYSLKMNEFIHNLSFSIENLLNQEYRNHLSRVKFILPESGFNSKLTYKLFFHL